MLRWQSKPGFLNAWCVIAAFGTYGCMYGLRKPFTAGSYLDEPFADGSKALLVTAQILGYTVSKCIGIRVIASLPHARRIVTLLGLLGLAELSLLLFAVVPRPFQALCLFLNGLPLGMVFGLVLGFIEGRRMTEAFVAGLCASFILADGFAKTVGARLLVAGVPEAWMPASAGLIFLLPLAGFVTMLSHIPPPTAEDIAARSERKPMTREDRRHWIRKHGIGLALIVLSYLMVTVLRSFRADFAPELWKALGVPGQPGIFIRSELWVTLGVVAVNGAAVFISDNRRALSVSLTTGCVGLLLVGSALAAQTTANVSPFGFMVVLGLGLYIPYVAIHTTVFERLIALTRDRGNLGYLMYIADAAGYLGYVGVMLAKGFISPGSDFLEFFRTTAWIVVGFSTAGLAGAWWQFVGRGESAPPPSTCVSETLGLPPGPPPREICSWISAARPAIPARKGQRLPPGGSSCR